MDMLTLLGKIRVILQKFTSTVASQNSQKISIPNGINENMDEDRFGADLMDFDGFL